LVPGKSGADVEMNSHEFLIDSLLNLTLLFVVIGLHQQGEGDYS